MAVLGAPTWIGQDLSVDDVGGYVPVQMSFDDQVVSFMCLPEANTRINGHRWSPWVIYARIKGRTTKTFSKFLSGSSTLVEYALCHSPDSQAVSCEHFP